MGQKYLQDLKNDLTILLDKYHLLNLWSDLVKSLVINLKFFLKNQGKNFNIKLIDICNKYNVIININDIKIIKEHWIIKIKLSNKKRFIIKIKFAKWNFIKEKEEKFQDLQKIFSLEIKKFNRLKKCILSDNQKVLLYPIKNVNYPIYNLSEEIKNNYLDKNFELEKLNVQKILLILKICSKEKVDDFFNFLYIFESRFINKMQDEIIPFIENIYYINSKNKIHQIFYSDAPDFIIITNYDAFGVEVTNIKKKIDYHEEQCIKEHLLRKIVNPNCFYSKIYTRLRQKNKIIYKQNDKSVNYKIESLSRHFANNNKYNRLIRKNGLKVKRGQKNFYILNGWDSKLDYNEKKLIKNIAIKKNIPSNRLIFFNL